MLEGLVYISAADPDISRSDIDNILSVSERNNSAAALTGVLLYSGSMFVQVLEGETEDIDALMNRVAKDARHDALTILSREAIDQRAFSDWAMAFRQIDTASADQLYGEIGWDKALDSLHTLPASHSMANLMDTLHSIVGDLTCNSRDLLQ